MIDESQKPTTEEFRKNHQRIFKTEDPFLLCGHSKKWLKDGKCSLCPEEKKP